MGWGETRMDDAAFHMNSDRFIHAEPRPPPPLPSPPPSCPGGPTSVLTSPCFSIHANLVCKRRCTSLIIYSTRCGFFRGAACLHSELCHGSPLGNTGALCVELHCAWKLAADMYINTYPFPVTVTCSPLIAIVGLNC